MDRPSPPNNDSNFNSSVGDQLATNGPAIKTALRKTNNYVYLLNLKVKQVQIKISLN